MRTCAAYTPVLNVNRWYCTPRGKRTRRIKYLPDHLTMIPPWTPFGGLFLSKLPRRQRSSVLMTFPTSSRRHPCPFRQAKPDRDARRFGRDVPDRRLRCSPTWSTEGSHAGLLEWGLLPERRLPIRAPADPSGGGRQATDRRGVVRVGSWRRNHGSACPHGGRPEPSPAGQVAPDRGVQRSNERRPLRLWLDGRR
jgi:hypothetical protein